MIKKKTKQRISIVLIFLLLAGMILGMVSPLIASIIPGENNHNHDQRTEIVETIDGN